jgi:uncharacterized protein (TIGR02246 family)
LANYEAALNASDVDAVMELYASDGVFMPQHSPSSVGSAAVRRAYEAVFHTITLRVTFDIVEVRQIAPDWAFARTNSAGTVRVNASNASAADRHRLEDRSLLFLDHESAAQLNEVSNVSNNESRGHSARRWPRRPGIGARADSRAATW